MVQQVSVLESALVCRIDGGSSRTHGLASAITLSANSSTDPDTNSRDGITFVWSCIRGGASYGAACGLSSDVLSSPNFGQAPQEGGQSPDCWTRLLCLVKV
jgi:hypothetical protein